MIGVRSTLKEIPGPLLVAASIALGYAASCLIIEAQTIRCYSNEERTALEIQMIESRVEFYRSTNGFYPATLDVLVQEEFLRDANDMWGQPYWYDAYDDGFTVVSAGMDRQIGTGDDVRGEDIL